MASEEMSTMDSSSVIDEEYDDGFNYQTRQSSLSRLSICTNSFHEEDDEDNFRNHSSDLSSFISGMSLDSFDNDDDDGAEADGEISDGDDESDKESEGFYSLPTIMSHRRRKKTTVSKSKYGHGFNGVEIRDSDGDGNCYSGGGGELTVLTKVKGGKKSMKMGFEEVKACRDLGFDLELPGRVSVSTGSNREIQTSSDNSPIANWRISSVGDDPKEVKARLKMWAQAVALASASR